MVQFFWLSWGRFNPPLGGGPHTLLKQDMRARKLVYHENLQVQTV